MEELLITGVRFLGALPMFVAAACLVFFNRGKLQSVVYDRSRWFITAATLLLGIHFAIQFVGQLREQSGTLLSMSHTGHGSREIKLFRQKRLQIFWLGDFPLFSGFVMQW